MNHKRACSLGQVFAGSCSGRAQRPVVPQSCSPTDHRPVLLDGTAPLPSAMVTHLLGEIDVPSQEGEEWGQQHLELLWRA